MATTRALKILARDGYRCVYCGRKGSKTVKLEIDHVTPRTWEGGTNELHNLATACSKCNNEKSDCDLATYCMFLRRKKGVDTRAMAARVKAALKRKV